MSQKGPFAFAVVGACILLGPAGAALAQSATPDQSAVPAQVVTGGDAAAANGQAPADNGADTNGQVPVADQSYILGPNDVIEVGIVGRKDFDTRARIGQDGAIVLPYLGQMNVANLTSPQLADRIGKALEAGGYYSHPVIQVDIVNYASRFVTVLGSVTTPGLVPIDRPYRLSEILARVGGVREGGADYVIVRPPKGAEKEYAVDTLATGDEDQDPYVTPGDKIFIPKAQLFYISGQVKSPGAYPMISGMTLRMAISRGGGLTDLGSAGHIKVTHKDGKAEIETQDSQIKSGDVIVIGERLF